MTDCPNCDVVRKHLEHRKNMIDKQTAQIELLKEMLEEAHRKLERAEY